MGAGNTPDSSTPGSPPPYGGHGPSTATIIRMVMTVLATLLLAYCAYLVRSAILLVVVSVFLAAGFDPAIRRIEHFGPSRGQAVAIMFVTALIAVTAFVFAVASPLVEQVTNLVTDFPTYVQAISEGNPQVRDFVQDNQIPERVREATQNIPSAVSSSFGSVLGVAGSILGGLFSLITVLVLTIYFLLSFSRLREGTLRLIPQSRRARAQQLADPIIGKIGSYIEGQIVIALLSGVLAFLFLTVLGVPFSIALALWVFLAGLVPLVGATIGAVPAVIVAFFSSVGVGIAVVVYFLIYQQVENYLVAPRIMNAAVDVSPAAVLLAALIGGTLLGFIGALMAIPVAASIKLITQEVLIPKAERH